MSQPNELPGIPFALIERIAEIIDIEKREITNRDLLGLCSEAGFEGLMIDPHLCHEIAETALNYLVKTKYGEKLLSSKTPSDDCFEILRPLQRRLPPQSWRSTTQITFQQFSTPAPIAYLASYLLNLNDSDTVLEPSCGTGSLAVWGLAAGATVVSNEIDSRRRELASLVGLEPTGHDAEFIDDLLPETLTPNVILANPPFSSSGGRVERNQSRFGFRHIESALRRLSAGGRFAVILGEGGSPGTVSGKRFWDLMVPGIEVTRSISISGREFYRNGTAVSVTLILGRKLSVKEPEIEVQCYSNLSFDNIEEAFETIRSE